MMKFLLLLLTSLVSLAVTHAFDHSIIGTGGLELNDVETTISDIQTIFTDQEIQVVVKDLEWNETGSVEDSPNLLFFETSVDGKVQATGSVNLTELGSRELPSKVEAGSIEVGDRGTHTITVKLTVDASEETTEGDYQAYPAGVSIIPLLIVLLLAVTTHMVEFSLFTAIFIGACMVSGTLKDGFKTTLDDYILNALANEDHGYVYLFTLFLAGLVGMLEKSGGMYGFTNDVAKYAKSARTGQFVCFCVGISIFFDDYANTLLAGKSLRPLLDMLFVSREKLAFIVDATAAPIASISPVSSWVGFEVGLIQEQIDRIIEQEGTEDIGIKTSGFGVFLQSIKYRYYPIFMIILMVALIYSQRDMGPMLIAERKTQVYERTDGGDGAGMSADNSEVESEANAPRKDIPQRSWNMVLPVALLVCFIFALLVKTGEDPSVSQSFMDKIEESNSYAALLWGTMAATMVTMIFYLLQPVKNGEYNFKFDAAMLSDLFLGFRRKAKDEDEGQRTRFLMSIGDSLDGFLFGMGRIFPALIVLTLAWASGSIMIAVGADRLFSSWIVGGISPEALPTLSFIISLFMALATGTSWGTMSILFPLIMVPTYKSSEGDAEIFYAVTAGVLSGSVAGDHMSPISDTTVLSALACDCDLLAHVSTQAPYAAVMVLVSIIIGTIPIGFGAWHNIISILLGVFLTVLFVYFGCAPVVSASGKFDICTELFMKTKEDSPLHDLKADTIKYHNGEDTTEGKPFDDTELHPDKGMPAKVDSGDEADTELHLEKEMHAKDDSGEEAEA